MLASNAAEDVGEILGDGQGVAVDDEVLPVFRVAPDIPERTELGLRLEGDGVKLAVNGAIFGPFADDVEKPYFIRFRL